MSRVGGMIAPLVANLAQDSHSSPLLIPCLSIFSFFLLYFAHINVVELFTSIWSDSLSMHGIRISAQFHITKREILYCF